MAGHGSMEKHLATRVMASHDTGNDPGNAGSPIEKHPMTTKGHTAKVRASLVVSDPDSGYF